MAEREELQKRYAYHEMSNKVEQADRSLRKRGEPTGEVESLRGREIGRMGDRVVTKSDGATLPSEAVSTRRKRGIEDTKALLSSKKSSLTVTKGETILELGNLTSYQPLTDQSRAAYESILTLLGSRELLGNQGPQFLRDAAEEVIILLKQNTTRDSELHDALSKLLTGKAANAANGLSTHHFTQLVQMGKQLVDYGKTQELPSQNNPLDGDTEREQVDDEMGVAVVFDDDDDDDAHADETGRLQAPEDADDDQSDIDVNVVVDGSSSEDEQENNDDFQENQNAFDDGDEDKLFQGSTAENDNQTPKAGRDGAITSKRAVRVLSVHEIDAHFLQRQLSNHFQDADVSAQMAHDILEIIDLRKSSLHSTVESTAAALNDLRECENQLLVLLGFELFDTIKLVLHNRVRIWACVSIKRASSDEERSQIEKLLMEEPTGEGKRVWEELHMKGKAQDWTRDRIKGAAKGEGIGAITPTTTFSSAMDAKSAKSEDAVVDMEIEQSDTVQATELDLDLLAFRDGAHIMSNKKCHLPDTSWRAMKKGYEEVHVPAVRSVIPADEKLVHINQLPSWTQAAFKGMDKLNRIQSKMCDVALRTSENLLLCAPTGAGKTNVACLAMLNILGQYRRENVATNDEDNDDEHEGQFDLQAFKIIYVAPMKALVQEVVKNFSNRLKDYGIKVRELTGDSSLTRQQISETQVLVTTPEKLNVVTRQGEGRAYTQLVKLVIVDEIHLLHDDRGPVLESLVARFIRQVETTAEPIRLVGLSATLPNYTDVAAFLRVNPEKGLFFFDNSFRPVPLQMQYIGITEKNAFKRFQLQNELCFEKALDQRRKSYQVLIFVHSRSETGKTAKALRDLALERDELTSFVRAGSATQEIIKEEAIAAKNADLKDVLPYGFAIHHAGMAREDRELVEDLFADRHIAVLCTTATLAWGVNLPAHAVIIRGTQIYNPAKGRWAELSPLDVLQMLGRAGRPQYDSEGEGIILTQHSELQYYLSLTNLQLPVESQLIKSLPDHLNAEIVLGTIQTITDAVEWLSYTFLYIRMLQNPSLYGILEDTLATDPTLKRRRLDLAHTAASILEKSQLIRYDRKGGSIQSTPLGRVASLFYISHSSMSIYNRHMRPNMSDIELLRLFSLSGEFAQLTVREEEKVELSKLAGRVPIPVKESPDEASAKINMLLQAYISRLKLDGFALVADMTFVQQSAARIMRALFEIALRRNWSSLAKLCLDMSNMVSYRVWRSQTPLRQFPSVPEVVARKLERKSDIEWARYVDLTASDLGELVGVPKMGRILHKFVHQFPRLELSAQIQPITRSLLRVELTLVPAFQFDFNIHGYVQQFHIIVEDVNGELILHHQTFDLRSSSKAEEHVLTFTVPILDPLQPAYFIRALSDRWLHSASVLPISLDSMILPAKFPPPTELLDLQPLLPRALGEQAFIRMYKYNEFNPIQTQTFHELFKTDNNCLVCAPSGSGKTVCAEFAIFRMLTSNADGKCVYVAPSEEIADPIFKRWVEMYGPILRQSSVVRLTGETGADLKLISSGKIIVCSCDQWDMMSRRWRQRKAVQMTSLIIFDDVHFLGGQLGPTLEVIISRTRYINEHLQKEDKHLGTRAVDIQQQEKVGSKGIRIIGLAASLANARDVGEWMGGSSTSIFNFSPKSRPNPLEIYFHAFEQSSFSGRLMAMAKPVFSALTRHIDGRNALVFVPSRRQAQLTAIDIMTYQANQSEQSLLDSKADHNFDETLSQLREPVLKQVVSSGIGFVYNGMVDNDWRIITDLYSSGVLRVLVCPADLCWKLQCVAHLIVIMGTESYDGKEGRHVDYPSVDLLHMMGRYEALSPGKCVILCHLPKKDYLKKLLFDPLPIESHLDSYLHDPLNAEIAVSKTVASMQEAINYVTWTFLYRRLPKNPTYYGLHGTSNTFLSEHLSEMIETVIGDLEESKCCKVSDDGDITPLNLGMIASYYCVQYRTIELMAASLTPKTKIRAVVEILSASSEFSALPLRYGEDKTMKMIARNLVYKLPDDASFDSNTKALILLQCHFSRKALPAELRADQRTVLIKSIGLIQAIVDVISSNGWLKPALAAMELSQMVVQGLWNKDHVLKQIPHFTDEIVKRCSSYEGEEAIESIFDILSLDDDVRNNLLKLPDDKMADVAVFCNNYPNIEVSLKVEDPDDIVAGEPVRVAVVLEREVDSDLEEQEKDNIGSVSAPLFPGTKKEGWWVVIGINTTNLLLSLKRVNLQIKQEVILEFLAPENAGDYELDIFCMCDSYLGCDQEYKIALSVAAPSQTDEDENSKGE